MEPLRPETTTATPVALWNPNAAAGWSILFTPLFGAYVQMLNWRALGDTEQEQASLRWVYAGVLFVAALLIVDATALDASRADAVSRAIEFAFLAAWYLMSGYGQAKAVKARFGAGYPRKSWRTPLLAALAGFGVYVLLTIAIAAVIGLNNL